MKNNDSANRSFCRLLYSLIIPLFWQGTVIIIANHGDRIDIPAGSMLENKIVSGNLRILDHWRLCVMRPGCQITWSTHTCHSTLRAFISDADLSTPRHKHHYLSNPFQRHCSSLCVLVSCPLVVLKLYVYYTNLIIVFYFSFLLWECSISLVVSMASQTDPSGSVSSNRSKMWKKECKAIRVLQQWRLTVLSLCSRTWSRSWKFYGTK